MSSHPAFAPGGTAESIARSFNISPAMIDRAKSYLPSHPMAHKALDYAKAHPGKAAAVAVGALWLAKKIFR